MSSGGHRVDLPVGFWGAVVWKLDSGGKLWMVGQLERREADPGLAEPRQPVFRRSSACLSDMRTIHVL